MDVFILERTERPDKSPPPPAFDAPYKSPPPPAFDAPDKSPPPPAFDAPYTRDDAMKRFDKLVESPTLKQALSSYSFRGVDNDLCEPKMEVAKCKQALDASEGAIVDTGPSYGQVIS